MIKKNLRGLLSLTIGTLFLIGNLIMYNTLDIDDVLLVMLMTCSIMILIYGLFQIIRDAYFK